MNCTFLWVNWDFTFESVALWSSSKSIFVLQQQSLICCHWLFPLIHNSYVNPYQRRQTQLELAPWNVVSYQWLKPSIFTHENHIFNTNCKSKGNNNNTQNNDNITIQQRYTYANTYERLMQLYLLWVIKMTKATVVGRAHKHYTNKQMMLQQLPSVLWLKVSVTLVVWSQILCCVSGW